MTWQGAHGAVILGPTQHRVALYLQRATRYGRVTLRSADLLAELRINRTDFYRITARLRALGLFGIENDRGGTHGGRRYWRITVRRDGRGLDPARHRSAWARIRAWLASRVRRDPRRTHAVIAPRDSDRARQRSARFSDAPAPVPPLGAGASFSELMRRAGLAPALAEAFTR